MNPKRKKYLLLCLAFVLVALMAGYFGVSYFINSAKPRIEQVASINLGMRVTINLLDWSLLTSSVSARKIEIDKGDSRISTIDTMQCKLDLRALLKGQVQIKELRLIRPEFEVARLENGTWNTELPEHDRTGNKGPLFLPRVVTVKDGSLILRDGKNLLELQGVSLTIRDMSLAGDLDLPLLARLGMAGDFSCRDMKWNKIVISDFTSRLQGLKGEYIFEPIIFHTSGGKANGRVVADMGIKIPRFAANVKVSDYKIEDFFSALSEKEHARGAMDLEANLTASGDTKQELLHSLNGNFDMTGQNLTITKLDLDALLEEYMHSQQFNLVDLGAFAVIGPLGPALTKSYDFSEVLNASKGGTTEVRQLVSNWRINEGMAVAHDVAFATKKNRIAVRGTVDIAANHFRNFLVAVVDANGCAIVSQEMNGPFNNPEVKKPSVIESAAGPILNIFRKAASIITKKKCDTVYNGSVAAPVE